MFIRIKAETPCIQTPRQDGRCRLRFPYVPGCGAKPAVWRCDTARFGVQYGLFWEWICHVLQPIVSQVVAVRGHCRCHFVRQLVAVGACRQAHRANGVAFAGANISMPGRICRHRHNKSIVFAFIFYHTNIVGQCIVSCLF